MENIKIFLGGTCNESKWREKVKSQLFTDIPVTLFDPVVDNWTPECIEIENREKESADILLFVITSRMQGVYSIAEAVDISNKHPDKLVFCVLPMEDIDYRGFTAAELKSLEAVKELIANNGCAVLNTFDDMIEYVEDFCYLKSVEKDLQIDTTEINCKILERYNPKGEKIDGSKHE